MRKPVFTGVCTALVTPFLGSQVNYPMLEQLLRHQFSAGIRAVVVGGTTGEAPTLSDSEKLELFSRAKQYSGANGTIIAGTGSNSTEHSIALSVAAEKCGADALLVVSPYYNKATSEGLYAHYMAIADAVHIPVILYNVPSRTGVDIPVEVYRRLSLHPNIAGVKEAASDITKINRIRSMCGEDFFVWTGNDEQTLPVLALGGQGIISVVSNVAPAEVSSMVSSALDGKFQLASEIQLLLQPLMEVLFAEVNPIPVKAAMKLIGFDCGSCRLPLTQPSDTTLKKLEAVLKHVKLLPAKLPN